MFEENDGDAEEDDDDDDDDDDEDEDEDEDDDDQELYQKMMTNTTDFSRVTVSLSPPPPRSGHMESNLLRLGEGPKAKNVLDTSDFDFEVPIAVVAT